ncbi:PKD domain-containing protein [Candidatus Poseidoniales archaeon]|nr:PKD domain-containing protein [Candidatus Poseidoniales archaeon]
MDMYNGIAKSSTAICAFLAFLMITVTVPVESLDEITKWRVSENETYDLEFNETVDFVSNKWLTQENMTLASTPERVIADATVCEWLQSKYAQWDCTLRQGGTNNDEWGSWDSDYDVLENEEYTFNGRIEYHYRLNHSGTVKVKETIASSQNQATTVTHEIIESNEVFNLSLKTSIVFEIYRKYTPVGHEHTIQTFRFEVPFPTLSDVDGDGTHRELGFNIPGVNTNKVYLWDNFTAVSNATSLNGLGSNLDLSGYINLIEIDLVQYAKSVLSNLGAGAGAAASLEVLSYFVEIWLTLSLDVDFYLQTLAKINVANDITTLQQSTDTHAERISNSIPLGFNDGRTDDALVPSTSEIRQINPLEDDLLSGLSFVYVGNSTESYSVNLEIRPSSKRINLFVWAGSLGETLWAIKGWEDPIRIPLVQDLFSSSSSHLQSTMTSAVHTSSMPTLPSAPPPNSVPQAGIAISSPQIFTGQSITLDSSSSQDADNDVLETSVSWGDGSVADWSTDSAFSHTFATPGTYEITSRVRDNLATSTPFSSTVVVTQQPYLGDASISANISQVEAGDSVSFTVSLTNIPNPDSILLSFGDGTNQTLNSGATITHTYSTPGLCIASVLVTDGDDLVSSIQNIEVIPNSNPSPQIDTPGEVNAENFSEEGSGEPVVTNSSSNSIGTESITTDAGVEGGFVNMTGLSTTSEYTVAIQLDITELNQSSGSYEWVNLFYDYVTFSPQSSTDTWAVTWEHLWIQDIHYATAVLYDQNFNEIANATLEFEFEVPELPTIDISDNGILLVIDTEGANYAAESSAWNSSAQNPTNGEETIFQATMTVAEIIDQDFDLFYVGDTDRDGVFDTTGGDGPGLGILQQYSTVIWTTGPEYYPLTESDEFHLSTYVNSGGSLILFSQDYLYGSCQTCDSWNFSTFANRTLGISSSNQDSGLDGLTGNDGNGANNIAYLLTAGLDYVQTRNITVNGFSEPFEDIIYTAEDDRYTLSIFDTYNKFSDTYESVGVSRMIIDENGENTGRLSYFAFDPASIVNRYDLELLILQSVNWSSQEFTSQDTPEKAAPIFIGQDGKSPFYVDAYGHQWYSINPEPGRVFSIEFTGEEIYDVSLYDKTGSTKLATFSNSFLDDTWLITTSASYSEIYTIKVENWNYQSQTWIDVESEYIVDDNPACWEYEYRDDLLYPPTLIVDGNPLSDQLAPYLSQGPDYSSSCFEAYLYSGTTYAVTVELFGEFNSAENSNDSISVYMDVTDSSGFSWWVADSAQDSNILEAVVTPTNSDYYEVGIYLFGYENPHLIDGNYRIHIWELPISHPADDNYAEANPLAQGYHYGWVDSQEDSLDIISWGVFDGEQQDIFVSFDRTVEALISVVWMPDDITLSPYIIDEIFANEGALISIDESGMGQVYLTIESNLGRANYSIYVEESIDVSILPFGDVIFSEVGVIDDFDYWAVEMLPGLPVVITFGTADELFNLSGAYYLDAWIVDPSGNMIYPNSDYNFVIENAEGGIYDIYVDGLGGGYWLWAFIDHEPIVYTEPTKSATVGEVYSTTFEAVHWIESVNRGWSLNGFLTYSIEEGPIGLVIDQFTGDISMTATSADLGVHSVTIIVESEWIVPLRYTYDLTVNDQPNNPPVVVPVNGIVAHEGELIQFSVAASDIDGDNLSIQLLDSPNGMIIDVNTWIISWTPISAGSYTITIEVTDERGESSTVSPIVTVFPQGVPIVRISAISSVWEGLEQEIAVVEVMVSLENATTYDCKLSYQITGQSVDQNCILSWENIPKGTHNVDIIVSSGIAEYSHIVTFNALENVTDETNNIDNGSNSDVDQLNLTDLEDNQNTGSSDEQEEGTGSADSASGDGLSVVAISSIIGVLILIISGGVFVIFRKKGNDDSLPGKSYQQPIESNNYVMSNNSNQHIEAHISATPLINSNAVQQQNHQPVIPVAQPEPLDLTPPTDMVGQQDQNGYEWVQFKGLNWYRQSGTNGVWIKWES